MIESGIIEKYLDQLLVVYDTDAKMFYKMYKSLPFEVYSEIERLSVSKSTLYKKLCHKAKTVSNNFHRSIE